MTLELIDVLLVEQKITAPFACANNRLGIHDRPVSESHICEGPLESANKGTFLCVAVEYHPSQWLDEEQSLQERVHVTGVANVVESAVALCIAVYGLLPVFEFEVHEHAPLIEILIDAVQ